MNRFFVYALVDPRSGEDFYIGKGTGNRPYAHTKPVQRGQNPYKDRVIDQILAEGKMYSVRYISKDLSETDAFRIEEESTQIIGLRIEGKGPLTNLRHGGVGGGSLIQTQEANLKRSEAMLGVAKSEEHRQNIALSKAGDLNPMYGKTGPNAGKKMSDEQKEKIRQSRIGKKASPLTRAKMSQSQKKRYS